MNCPGYDPTDYYPPQGFVEEIIDPDEEAYENYLYDIAWGELDFDCDLDRDLDLDSGLDSGLDIKTYEDYIRGQAWDELDFDYDYDLNLDGFLGSCDPHEAYCLDMDQIYPCEMQPGTSEEAHYVEPVPSWKEDDFERDYLIFL